MSNQGVLKTCTFDNHKRIMVQRQISNMVIVDVAPTLLCLWVRLVFKKV